MEKKDPAKAGVGRAKGFRYKLIAEGAVIGLITGALISLFRLMLTCADRLRDRLVEYAAGGAGPAQYVRVAGHRDLRRIHRYDGGYHLQFAEQVSTWL